MSAKRNAQRLIILFGIILAVFYLSPLYVLFINSFKTQKGIYLDTIKFPKGDYFTLANYPEAIERMGYIKAFTNSFLITVIATVLLVFFSSMAAWVLVRYKNKVSSIIFTAFAVAMLIPFQCVMLPLLSTASSLKMLNPVGLVFMYIGFGSSLNIIMFHGFIKSIPLELEEAALLDGCSMFQTFFIIILPLVKTIAVTVAVLNAMWIWNDFLLPQLIINKPEWQTIPLRTFLFFGQFSKRWDLATAALLMGMVPIIIFYLFMQKHIVKGITDGAIK